METVFYINYSTVISVVNQLKKLPYNDVEGLLLALQSLEEVNPDTSKPIGFVQTDDIDVDNED